jgi:flagellar export protein FliJ
MQKFSFRLTSVLRFREMQLALEREKLRRLLNEAVRLERSLASLAQERQEALIFVQNDPEASHTELRALSAFVLGSEARAITLREDLHRIQNLIADQRQRVIAADRNERLLLKLKEKKFGEWRRQNDLELEAVAQECWAATRR